MRARWWLSICLGLVLGVGATRVVAQGAKPEARPLLVGVVDIGVAFKDYKRKETLEAEVNELKATLEREVAAKRREAQRLRSDLDLLDPEGEAFHAKRGELLRLTKVLEVDGQLAEERLKARVEELTLRLLAEIEDVVAKVTDEQGFDLVLKVDSKGWGGEKFQERIFRAQIGAVLRYKLALDITRDVVRALNDPANLEKRTFR